MVVRPEPVLTPDGWLEHHINRILEERQVGRGQQYLVCWAGFGAEDDEWLPRKELLDYEALDICYDSLLLSSLWTTRSY